MKCGLCNEVIDTDEGCMRCGELFKIGSIIFCITIWFVVIAIEI